MGPQDFAQSKKASLLDSLVILSTTLLVMNLDDPVLNLQFFRDPKCLSKAFSSIGPAFGRLGPFQST